MSLTLLQLDSRQQLAAHAPQWNRLWAASAATLPTLSAGCLAQWLAAFSPQQPFRALVVARGEQWLAALPLVAGRFKGLLPSGVAPSNDWGLSFDLLFDEACDAAPVLGVLAQGLSRLPWGFLSLHDALLDEPRWQLFREACAREGLVSDWRPQLKIARLNITHDWTGYRRTWSKSHRRHLEKYERALAAVGPVTVEWRETISPHEVQPLLARGIALEQRGWKGKQGATLHHEPHVWTYLQAQAQELAAAGHLRMAFLRVGDRDAAFEYGWLAKGVYYSFKVAYDAEFAHASPSHVLSSRLLEKFHTERGQRSEVRGQEAEVRFRSSEERVQGSGFRIQEITGQESLVTDHDVPVRAFDFLCPLSPAVAHWRPTTYTVGRALIAPRGMVGSLAIRAQHLLAPAYAYQPEA